MVQEIKDKEGKVHQIEIAENLKDYKIVEYISRDKIVFTDGVFTYVTSQKKLKLGKGVNARIALDQTAHFKIAASIKHNSKYEYEKTIYVKSNSKVIITCTEHGDFEQIPASHLMGKGCRKCDNLKKKSRRKYTREQLIIKLNFVHENKYQYPAIEDTADKSKIKIECPLHGVFEQVISCHLSGQGCAQCGFDKRGFNKRTEPDEFITRCREKHEDKYDYSLTKYIRGDDKIKIICPSHGEFYQRASKHLFGGKGCAKCGDERAKSLNTSSIEQNIIDFKNVHGDRYDYSKIQKLKCNQKIEIGCPIHGAFFQSITGHKSGSGCPACAKILAVCVKEKVKIKEAYLIPCSVYTYKFSNEYENFYKVGISWNIKRRTTDFKRYYNTERLFLADLNIPNSILIEDKVLKFLKPFQYFPDKKFAGYSECFTIDPTETVKKFINDLQEQE